MQPHGPLVPALCRPSTITHDELLAAEAAGWDLPTPLGPGEHFRQDYPGSPWWVVDVNGDAHPLTCAQQYLVVALDIFMLGTA